MLCVALLDDRLLPAGLRGVPSVGRRAGARLAAAGVMVLGVAVTVEAVTRQASPLSVMTQALRPLRLANPYGLFAVMTTQRDELVVEGSMDGETWSAYRFPFKPGEPSRAPAWATPHQPRLDWQMWFAALTTPERAPWTYDLAFALLEARPHVLALLEDPFDGARPKYVRILRRPYRFTTPDERARTGHWWAPGESTVWLAPVRLRRPVVTHEPLTL